MCLPWAQANACDLAPGALPQGAIARGQSVALAPATQAYGPSTAATLGLGAADDSEASVRLAVALDILATHTRAIGDQTDILSAFTDALLALRETHVSPQGLDGEAAQELGLQLRDLALGPVGEARAAICAPLAACSQALGPIASDRDGVALACRRLEAAARATAEHVTLRLDAQQAWAKAR